MSILSELVRGYHDARAQYVPPPSQHPFDRRPPEDRPSPPKPAQRFADAELESELATAKQTILELADALEEQDARNAELQGELDETQAALSEGEAILEFPGVRMLLLAAFHPDKHPATADRAALNEMTKRILAVYDRMKGE